VTRGFRLGQLGSGGLLALAHGTNAVSLLIRGAARSAEHRRAGNGAAAAANTAVALLALVVCLGAVVAAIVVMTAK
jgi:hypothetical protein